MIDVAERLYAERFDRLPSEEPWRSRWLRLETLHSHALREGNSGDHKALYAACLLADARYTVELEWHREIMRRHF